MLFPNIFSIIHNIEHKHEYKYEHDLCDNPNETHLHKIENDCDFCKSNINHNYNIIKTNLGLVRAIISKTLIHTSYSFQYNYQQLSFSLRGPPVLV